MELRNYQKDAINKINEAFLTHDRVLLSLCTGAGKSLLFSHITREKVKTMPVVIVVRGRSLVLQASKNLKRLGIEHSVFMGDHYLFDRKSRVQVCSIDSIFSRKCYPFEKECPFVVIDESHMASIKGKKYAQFFEHYSHAKILGFTGSPFPYPHVFQEVIEGIHSQELRDQGYLSPVRIYIPKAIDTSKVKIIKGEFNQTQLEAVCSTNEVLGDIVKSYLEYGEGKRGILFAVNIANAKLITDRLNEAGISAAQINSEEHENYNNQVIKDFKEGKIKLLVNVNMASVGVDFPFVEILVLARPTLSMNLHIQQLGRCLRPSPGKKDAVILDLATNCLRFGGPYQIRTPFPDNVKKQIQKVTMSVCENCFRVSERKLPVCEFCGYQRKKKEMHKKIEYKDSELQLLQISQDQEKRQLLIAEYERLKRIRITKRIHWPSWAEQEVLKKFGVEFLKKYGDAIGFPDFLLKD